MANRLLIIVIFSGILFSLVPAQTDTITIVDGVDFKGTNKSLAWSDGDGDRREIFVNQATGHISRFMYDTLDCQDIYNHTMSGLNCIISHCTSKYYSSRQHATGITFTNVFQGRYHALHRVAFFWPHYVRKADVELPEKIKVVFDYLVTTGQDYLLIAYTFDTSRLPDLSRSLDGYDTRAPYNDIDWNGNRLPDVHHYVCHWQSGTDCTFKFNVVDTTWTKTFNDNLVSYNMLWNYESDRAFGIVATENYADKPMGEEWLDDTTRVRADSSDTLRPGGHPFQNTAFESYRGEKITWGSQWCIGSDSLAMGGMVLDGYPYYNYSVMVLLDRHSDDKVMNLVREQERYNNCSISAVTGGTVLSGGSGGPGDPTLVTWKKAGYNPVYRSWEVWADSDRVAFTWEADTIAHPTFIIHNYNTDNEPDSVMVSTVKGGAVLTNGVDYFASVDDVAAKLYVTFDYTFTGTNDIRISGRQQKSAPVVIIPEGGVFTGQVPVVLSTREPGATVYYSLDGSVPDSTSQVYSDTLFISQSGTLRAVAWVASKEPSGVAGANFTIRQDTLAPWIDTIIAYGDPRKLVVYFSEEVATGPAWIPGNYAIYDGVTVDSAQVDYDLPYKITLTTSPLDSGSTYILLTSHIRDPGGNPVKITGGNTFTFLSYPAPDLERGLTGMWNFNEGTDTVAFDGSWNGNHGKIHGAAWTAGRFGQALLFDGVDDYVQIDTAQFGISKTNEFSVSLWFNIGSGDSTGMLIRRGTGPYPFAVEYSGTGYIQTTVRTYTISQQISQDSLEADTWHHLVLTYKSGSRSLYIDNRADPVDRLEGLLNVSPVQTTEIGKKFNGIMDNIRIYNRCLRAEEAEMLYNQANDTVRIITAAADIDLDNFGIKLAPNPLGSGTCLTCTFPHLPNLVALSIHDLTGACVHRFKLGTRPASWDGTGPEGQPVAGGVYLVRIQLGRQVITKKIMVAW